MFTFFKNSLFIIISSLSFIFAQNHSLSFDGDDDYVSIGASADFDVADELTIFATIKPESYDCASIIDRLSGSAGEGYRLNLRGNCSSENGVVWSTFGSASSSVFAQSDDSGYSLSEWVTITGVWKNNNYVKLYINGNLVESTFSDRSFDTDRPLEFARLGYDNTEYFNGLIDEVSIWNVALSESEINSYAFTQLSGNETNLVGYWNFNEGEGTTLADLSGNENNGTIYGATWNDEGYSFSKTWHVATTGSDDTGDGTESNPYATIQKGVDRAVYGDTVLVHPGTYGHVNNVNSIYLVSAQGPNQTVIDANLQNTAIHITVISAIPSIILLLTYIYLVMQ